MIEDVLRRTARTNHLHQIVFRDLRSVHLDSDLWLSDDEAACP